MDRSRDPVLLSHYTVGGAAFLVASPVAWLLPEDVAIDAGWVAILLCAVAAVFFLMHFLRGRSRTIREVVKEFTGEPTVWIRPRRAPADVPPGRMTTVDGQGSSSARVPTYWSAPSGR